MLQAIKQAAIEAIDSGKPVSVLFGTISKINPLEVNVDQRFTIEADFLIVPESLTRYEIELRHSHTFHDGTTGDSLTEPIVIRKGLEVGNKVILLRVQGGQKFVILDKVVGG